jgi:hypothetical protein
VVVKIVFPGPGRSYGKGTFPLTSTGGSQFTTKVLPPTSFTVSVTLAPGGKFLATQSVVRYARFETHPLTPGGIDEFGVAVHVGVGPARGCGGGMTVAVGVGGRGVGVVGGGVLGATVGDGAMVDGGTVGVGENVSGALAASAAEVAETTTIALAVAGSVAAGATAPAVSRHPTATKTIAISPACRN